MRRDQIAPLDSFRLSEADGGSAFAGWPSATLVVGPFRRLADAMLADSLGSPGGSFRA